MMSKEERLTPIENIPEPTYPRKEEKEIVLEPFYPDGADSDIPPSAVRCPGVTVK